MDDKETRKILELLGMIEDGPILSKTSVRQQSGRKFEKYSRLKPCKLTESTYTTLKSREERNDA